MFVLCTENLRKKDILGNNIFESFVLRTLTVQQNIHSMYKMRCAMRHESRFRRFMEPGCLFFTIKLLLRALCLYCSAGFVVALVVLMVLESTLPTTPERRTSKLKIAGPFWNVESFWGGLL
mmetsp:Transcript_40032/g.64944  ORF Transcript_40032/g.64944 Transcript_40032/m.64944 type:complete len:121 (-) Transcript_40032:586-948(-)